MFLAVLLGVLSDTSAVHYRNNKAKLVPSSIIIVEPYISAVLICPKIQGVWVPHEPHFAERFISRVFQLLSMVLLRQWAIFEFWEQGGIHHAVCPDF
ncbi:hypothetical protein AYI69_g1294 [Smittium culicis]|uniref:Uncharacterized protein n=1 Tax=Smittium culicis TaxID=133412 RepID=A0A1R1YQP5_9FUNG|nr:hypothetical protein AYI69_g1294 [Smittium culicis]